MPVRFRCVYCNQLLGIARRKAGTVVRCTNCEGQIIVPEPEPVAAGARSRSSSDFAPNLLEQNNLDDLLKPFQPTSVALADDSSVTAPSSSGELISLGDSFPSAGVRSARLQSLSRWARPAIAGIAIFALGYFVGRMTTP